MLVYRDEGWMDNIKLEQNDLRDDKELLGILEKIKLESLCYVV